MEINLKYASLSVWQEVSKKVKDAAVFIDEPAAECLSWHGGVHLLLDAGARSVREFSSFEKGDGAKKAVFIVSSPLTGQTRFVLRDLISDNSFEHSILVTSCSPAVLTLATTGNVSGHDEEMSALRKLEADMLHWMKNEEAAAEIFHLLISCAPVSDRLFFLPQFSHVMPPFVEDLVGRTTYSILPRNLDVEALPLELQVTIVHIMTTLNSLLSKLNARESIYCMGLMSSLVGSQLQKHAASAVRLRSAERGLSLLLIDRNFDVCGPLMSSTATTMDMLKSTLPPLPGHCVDVAVDMSSVCLVPPGVVNDVASVLPGCLHDPPSELIDTLINRPNPDILPLIYTQLASALEIPNLPKKITLQDLENLISSHFDKNYENIAKNLILVQVAIALVNASKSSKSKNVVESLQKMIFQSMSANGECDEALQRLIQVIYERRDRGLDVDSIVALLVFTYSLIGSRYRIDIFIERSLKEAVVEMMTEESAKNDHPSNLVRKVSESGNVGFFCDRLFSRLRALKTCRGELEKYTEVSIAKDPACPLEYEGVLEQLLGDVVDVTRPETPDLRYKGNISQRNNFTSRFAMMLNSSKPHVMDNEEILVFVIGGITGSEIKYINNIFRVYNKRVIVGSTTLLSPGQIVDNLFVHDPLKPFAL